MKPSGTTLRRIAVSVVIAAAAAAGIMAVVRVGRLGMEGSGLSTEYQYDLSAMAHIDPELIVYGEIGAPIATGLSQTRALAIDASGTLYVAGDQTIKVIEPDGRIKDSLALSVAPRCLAPAGEQLYIGTRDRVLIADRRGEVQATWPSLGDDALITSIALDEDHVYIADAGQRIVWCYGREGRFIRRIGDRDRERNIPGFVIPSPHFDLAMAPDGLLRVVNSGRHQIEAYTVKGDREFAWGEFGNTLESFTGCCNPVSFAILPDGRFVTCEKGLVRVKVYGADGLLEGVVAGPQQLTDGVGSICETPAQCQRGGFDVAVDAAGRVYILDTIENVVRTFAPKEPEPET